MLKHDPTDCLNHSMVVSKRIPTVLHGATVSGDAGILSLPDVQGIQMIRPG
jgi:hypothetical protein